MCIYQSDDVITFSGSLQLRQGIPRHDVQAVINTTTRFEKINLHHLHNTWIDFHSVDVIQRRNFAERLEYAIGGGADDKHVRFGNQSIDNSAITLRKSHLAPLGMISVVFGSCVIEVVIEKTVVGDEGSVPIRYRVNSSLKAIISLADLPATCSAQYVLVWNVDSVVIHQACDVEGVGTCLHEQQGST